MGNKWYDKKEDTKDEESGVRGYFQMGDKTIYWEGWDNPRDAEYDIKRMLNILKEKGK